MRKSGHRDGSLLKVENVPVSGEPEKVESARYLGGSAEKAGALSPRATRRPKGFYYRSEIHPIVKT
jgi:hypothetical protein